MTDEERLAWGQGFTRGWLSRGRKDMEICTSKIDGMFPSADSRAKGIMDDIQELDKDLNENS